MMMFRKLPFLSFCLLIGLLFSSCDTTPDDEEPTTDSFDRSAMLQFWADQIIMPAMEDYDAKLDELLVAKDDFISSPNTNSLSNLQTKWLAAYKAWQHISMFEIGQAEAIGYRNFVNIFPTDTAEIASFIQSQNYNLSLPSTFDAQGFPALDYLLYGLGEDANAQLAALNETNHLAYLSDVVDRLKSLHTEVLDDWKNGYRDAFIANDGSSATASTDKMVNDFLFYYEKFFRAGKLGIPSGVFSGTPIANSVEAPYSAVYSKELYVEAFTAVRNFFDGKSFDGTTTANSLKQYLTYTQELNNTYDIAEAINQQWDIAQASSEGLLDNFKLQVEQDHIRMLETYDEVQKTVPLLKVDMMQAFNIQVDFVDADGD